MALAGARCGALASDSDHVEDVEREIDTNAATNDVSVPTES